jgi:hypothetical protein
MALELDAACETTRQGQSFRKIGIGIVKCASAFTRFTERAINQNYSLTPSAKVFDILKTVHFTILEFI